MRIAPNRHYSPCSVEFCGMGVRYVCTVLVYGVFVRCPVCLSGAGMRCWCFGVDVGTPASAGDVFKSGDVWDV